MARGASRGAATREGTRCTLRAHLTRSSLEAAYDALLPEIPSHLALWELMTTHARAQGTTRELLPLIVRALAEDDALYLSVLGLAITWRDLGDTLVAQPYAATVLDFAADHPLAHELMREVAGRADAKPLGAPAAPASRGSSPQLPAPPPRANPYADDRQVKRAPAPHALPPKAPHKISSRLSLLEPPPARATPLPRDISPISHAPSAPARAPA